jgi:hypothetical protein
MRTWFTVLLLLLSLSLSSHPAIAQSDQQTHEPPQFSTRIQVSVSAPEAVKDAITTLINKELQALGDATVSDNNPNYRLTIMAIPNRTRQENFGFTFSVLITRPLGVNVLSPFLLSDKLDEKEKGLLLYLSSRYEYIEKRSLLTSANEEIPKTIHEIVQSFNTDLIEKDRKLWQMVWGQQPKNPAPAMPEQKLEQK